jgi:tRNA threonylcarbamoyladenosine biosynthesis protein TsaE
VPSPEPGVEAVAELELPIVLATPADTRAFGRHLAGLLPPAALLLLSGPLGAGKTSLVQGLAEALGVVEPVTSPTFALAQHYPGLVHLDLYRLPEGGAADELLAQEEEVARELGWLLAVEWPERLCWPPADAWRVRLEPAGDGRHLWVLPPLPPPLRPDSAIGGPAAGAGE